jgi:hypothetical protein
MYVRLYDTSDPLDWKHYKTVHYLGGQWTITDGTFFLSVPYIDPAYLKQLHYRQITVSWPIPVSPALSTSRILPQGGMIHNELSLQWDRLRIQCTLVLEYDPQYGVTMHETSELTSFLSVDHVREILRRWKRIACRS